jgi:hypothetical protein
VIEESDCDMNFWDTKVVEVGLQTQAPESLASLDNLHISLKVVRSEYILASFRHISLDEFYK